MLREAISSGTLANPVRLSSFLSAASAAIKVDQRLNVTSLADQLRGISPSDVSFMTVPMANMNYRPRPASLPCCGTRQAAAGSSPSSRQDDPIIRKPTSGMPWPGPAGAEAAAGIVDVYNGTHDRRAVSEHRPAACPARLQGARRRGVLDVSNISQTVIQYPPGMQASARLVRKVLRGATLQQVSWAGQGPDRARHERASGQRLAGGLGRGGLGRGGLGRGGPGGRAGAPGQRRTAAQDACR